jgi:hypothetical protein
LRSVDIENGTGTFSEVGRIRSRSGVFSPRRKTETRTMYVYRRVQKVFRFLSSHRRAWGSLHSYRECREWIPLPDFASPKGTGAREGGDQTQTNDPCRICGIVIFLWSVCRTHEPVAGSTISCFGAVLIKASMVPRFESKRHYLQCGRAARSTIPIRVANAPP